MKKTLVIIILMMLIAAFAASAEGVSVGDTVTFGSYPQGADGEVMPIEWTVLDIDEDGYYVLLSVYGLEAKAYNEKSADVTWEECTLRAWLNGEFLNAAFSAEEIERIKITRVANNDNAEFGTPGGNDTEDRVYLLSLDEITLYYGIAPENYRETHDELCCRATEYAAVNGALLYDHTNFGSEELAKYDGNGLTWLRSPGHYKNYAAIIGSDGFVNSDGYGVTYRDQIVRPVVRARLN